MGYYTKFDLYVLDRSNSAPLMLSEGEGLAVEIDEALQDITGYDWSIYDPRQPYMFGGESQKWYDHHENMLELSKRFPLIIFRLEGDGEENGDMWAKWYLDGKSYEETAPIWRPSPLDMNKFR